MFVGNIAESEGGVIKWTGVEPYLENNTFFNNSAVYGDIIASFPYRIYMSSSSYVKTICKMNSSERCYQTFPNITSGSLLNFSLEFLLKDIYNQTCSSINNE